MYALADLAAGADFLDWDVGCGEEGSYGFGVGQAGGFGELGEADVRGALRGQLVEKDHDVDGVLGLRLLASAVPSGVPRDGLPDASGGEQPGCVVAGFRYGVDDRARDDGADREDAAARELGRLLPHGRLVGGHETIPVSHAPDTLTAEARGTAA